MLQVIMLAGVLMLGAMKLGAGATSTMLKLQMSAMQNVTQVLA